MQPKSPLSPGWHRAQKELAAKDFLVKRYLLFWCAQYYPSGGWDDLLDSFDSVEEAYKEIIKRNHPRDLWFGDFQLIDVQTGGKVDIGPATSVYWEKK